MPPLGPVLIVYVALPAGSAALESETTNVTGFLLLRSHWTPSVKNGEPTATFLFCVGVAVITVFAGVLVPVAAVALPFAVAVALSVLVGLAVLLAPGALVAGVLAVACLVLVPPALAPPEVGTAVFVAGTEVFVGGGLVGGTFVGGSLDGGGLVGGTLVGGTLVGGGLVGGTRVGGTLVGAAATFVGVGAPKPPLTPAPSTTAPITRMATTTPAMISS